MFTVRVCHRLARREHQPALDDSGQVLPTRRYRGRVWCSRLHLSLDLGWFRTQSLAAAAVARAWELLV
jgi:hypothetical protein